ncbi:hypothetical protein TanjilG_07861 [Lupinus angustifolius]|uniref:BZIP domain-containing protein n=2 Tax=Lupinus angustifolius TaxID=3871 RepID=A0A1J7G7N0_LUPAN|nr:hypothetical protein TanjilG_07861 [Lupinus angustifolius]
MVKDEWVQAAMTNDTLVVELLLRLKKTVSPKSKTLLPLTWGRKQPRSTSRSRLPPVQPSRCGGAGSTRCSPTTPLSWSGGASPSDTADCNDDSNRHHAVRSKATATSGYTGNSASTKKCRRKKTFAELKEEESSLLKERVYLEKEIANKNANFEAERALNERMKRIKLDFGSKWLSNPSSTSVELHCTPAGQPHQRIVVPFGPPEVTHATQDESNSHATQDESNSHATHDESNSHASQSRECFSLIPDLNMMPPDAGSYTEDLC